jgi:hypothetical protein
VGRGQGWGSLRPGSFNWNFLWRKRLGFRLLRLRLFDLSLLGLNFGLGLGFRLLRRGFSNFNPGRSRPRLGLGLNFLCFRLFWLCLFDCRLFDFNVYGLCRNDNFRNGLDNRLRRFNLRDDNLFCHYRCGRFIALAGYAVEQLLEKSAHAESLASR